MMEDERRALIKAIIDDPENDTPRLVFADWLEENDGQQKCRWCSSTGFKSGGKWESDYRMMCPDCKGSGRVPNGCRERAAFVRLQCRDNYTPDWTAKENGKSGPRDLTAEQQSHRFMMMPELRLVGWDDGQVVCYSPSHASSVRRVDVVFRRGFIDTVSCTLADWLTHGPAICREHPVQPHVGMVTDKIPTDGGNRYFWTVTDMSNGNLIPNILDFHIRDAHLHCGFDYVGVKRYWFKSPEDARLALSRAAIAWARSQPVPT